MNPETPVFLRTVLFLLLLSFTAAAQGQPAPPLNVTLLDGQEVSLFARDLPDSPETAWHYAPFGLRLATNRSGHPEFSFLAYRQDSTSAILGGILHFLLTWGPTPDQAAELRDLLWMRTDTSQYVAGSLPLQRDTTVEGLEIGPPDHPLAQLLVRGLNAVPPPPLMPGGKMAASFSFTAEDARRLAEVLNTPEAWEDVFLRVHLRTHFGRFRPAPPERFTLTQSFNSCLESL